MKLPGISYGPVQSLGDPSKLIGAVGKLASAQIREKQALAEVGLNIISVGDEFNKQQAEEAIGDATIELQQRSLAFHEDLDQKDYYTSAELDEKGILGFEDDTRELIPTHEIRPEAYRQRMDDSIEELGNSIKRDHLKKKWVQDARALSSTHASKFTLESLKLRKQERKRKLHHNIDQAAGAGRYDMAQAIAQEAHEEGIFSPKELDEETVSLRSLQEKFNIEQVRQFGTLEEVEAEIARLSTDTLYEESGGNLDGANRQASIRNLQSKQKSILAGRGATDKTADAVFKRESTEIINGMLSGVSANPDQELAIEDNLDRLPPDLRAKFIYARKNWDKISEFNMDSLPNQRKFIADGDLSPAERADFQQAYDANLLSVKKSELAHAQRIGLVETDPLDFADARYLDTLTKRFMDYNMVDDMYGSANGPLYPDEAMAIKGRLDTMNSIDASNFIASTFAASYDATRSNDFAHKLFEQIGEDDPSAYAPAARAVMDNTPQVSKKILEGRHRMKNLDPETMKEARLDIREELGALHYRDPELRESTQKAAEQYYAYDYAQNGEADATKAVNAVTQGGPVVYHGQAISSPSSAISEDQLTSWFNRLHPEYIEQLGGVVGLANYDFVVGINNGDFILQDAGFGEWYVLQPTGNPFMNKRGFAFVLKYSRGQDSYMDHSTRKKTYAPDRETSLDDFEIPGTAGAFFQ